MNGQVNGLITRSNGLKGQLISLKTIPIWMKKTEFFGWNSWILLMNLKMFMFAKI